MVWKVFAAFFNLGDDGRITMRAENGNVDQSDACTPLEETPRIDCMMGYTEEEKNAHGFVAFNKLGSGQRSSHYTHTA